MVGMKYKDDQIEKHIRVLSENIPEDSEEQLIDFSQIEVGLDQTKDVLINDSRSNFNTNDSKNLNDLIKNLDNNFNFNSKI